MLASISRKRAWTDGGIVTFIFWSPWRFGTGQPIAGPEVVTERETWRSYLIPENQALVIAVGTYSD
jgi:hypothetical protein